jgi:homoaconitase/3-isopropylmalate dehydratase large subunit
MGQTIAEKIFSSHCEKKVHAGDFCLANLDRVMAHDTTCAWALEPFYQIARKVWDPTRIVLPFDHAFPAPNVQMAKLQSEITKFAEEQGIPILYDGVCHQIMSERFTRPGELVLGADSHSPTGGGIGALTIGVGSTDAAIAMATGKSWFRVPATIRIEITGRLPHGCYAKDVVLMVAKDMGPDGGNYRVLEYAGEVVEGFNIPSRLTLTNMSAEMGAKTAIVAPDAHTKAYLRENDRDYEFEFIRSDPDAKYERVEEYSVNNLTPLEIQLGRVRGLLPLAAATDSKMGAAGGSTQGGFLKQLQRLGLDVALLYPPYTGLHPVARNSAWNKNN